MDLSKSKELISYKENEDKIGVKQRTVLWYLVFVGFAVNYMIRINLNITIVDMIQQNFNKKEAIAECTGYSDRFDTINLSRLQDNSSQSTNQNETLISMIRQLPDRNKTYSLERRFLDSINVKYDKQGFQWNAKMQGLLLGSFYWVHWVTQIPGGILAKKYGTKIIFGLANVIGCWICFALPIVSYLSFEWLLWLRLFQGLICGLAWPAMHHMTAQWIPPNERSKFVTAYLGSSVGIAVFFPFFGYIISISSWEWVFHVCGIIGTIWWLGWLYFVYDTPSQHPRIKNEELQYINKTLGSMVQGNKKNLSVPWKSILTSRPVWMNVLAQWGGIWGLFTLMTQAPTYFKMIHGWDITMTGILSGFPHLMRMAFALLVSNLGDYALKRNLITRSNVRKIATAFCTIVKGIFVLMLGYVGCNSTAAIILLTIATACHGAVSTGPLASVVDLSPNHAGIVLGISGMIGVLPGFISPIIVGYLTAEHQTTEQWKYVFLIAAGMLIVSGIFYVIFCKSELQPWNNVKSNDIENEKDAEEMKLNPQHTNEITETDENENENKKLTQSQNVE